MGSEPGPDRWSRAVALSLLGAAVVWHGLLPLAGYDLWWQLAMGREIAETGSSLPVEPFSHTYERQPWAYKDAGGALVYHGTYALGGLAGLVILKAVVFLGTVALLWRLLVHDRQVPWALAVVLLAVSIPAVAFRFTERPQIFSFLLCVVYLRVLERHRAGRGSSWWTVPIVVLNANLHRAALLLPLIFGGYALARGWEAWRSPPTGADGETDGRSVRSPLVELGLIGVLNGLAILATPFGLSIFSTSVAMVTDPVLHGAIPEWWAATPSNLWAATPATVLVLLALAGGVAARGREQDPWDLALVLLALVAGFRGVRFLPYVVLLGLLPAGSGLARLESVWASPRRHLIAIGAALTSLAAVMSAAPSAPRLGVEPRRYPEEALAFLEQEEVRGHVFNDFRHGGYLMFHTDVPVYIDGRNDILYSREFIREYLDTAGDPALFERVVAEHEIEWLLLDHRPDDQAWGHVDLDPRWVLVHVSEHALIYVRRDGPNADLATRRGYRMLRPHLMSRSILHGLGDPRTAAQTLAELERLVDEDPDSVDAHVALAKGYALLGDPYAARLAEELELLRGWGVELGG